MTNLYVFVNLGDLLNHIVGIGEVEKRNRKLKDIHIIPTFSGQLSSYNVWRPLMKQLAGMVEVLLSLMFLMVAHFCKLKKIVLAIPSITAAVNVLISE